MYKGQVKRETLPQIDAQEKIVTKIKPLLNAPVCETKQRQLEYVLAMG
jgi:hypothetical protein